MKALLSSFLIIMLTIFGISSAYAKMYTQTMKLKVTTTDGVKSSYACFKTTDVTDAPHCGNTSHKYLTGPKNWELMPSIALVGDQLYLSGSECKNMFNSKQRTMDEDGTLTIYVTVGKNDENYIQYSNCHTEWEKK